MKGMIRPKKGIARNPGGTDNALFVIINRIQSAPEIPFICSMGSGLFSSVPGTGSVWRIASVILSIPSAIVFAWAFNSLAWPLASV